RRPTALFADDPNRSRDSWPNTHPALNTNLKEAQSMIRERYGASKNARDPPSQSHNQSSFLPHLSSLPESRLASVADSRLHHEKPLNSRCRKGHGSTSRF